MDTGINTKMTKQSQIEKAIFETVYQWGRVGIKVDYKADTFQKMIKELIKESQLPHWGKIDMKTRKEIK